MELINNLQWRYAVKEYSDAVVSEDKIDHIIDAVNLTASSCGIQPYRLIVITNPETRQKLGEGHSICKFRRLRIYWFLQDLTVLPASTLQIIQP